MKGKWKQGRKERRSRGRRSGDMKVKPVFFLSLISLFVSFSCDRNTPLALAKWLTDKEQKELTAMFDHALRNPWMGMWDDVTCLSSLLSSLLFSLLSLPLSSGIGYTLSLLLLSSFPLILDLLQLLPLLTPCFYVIFATFF